MPSRFILAVAAMWLAGAAGAAPLAVTAQKIKEVRAQYDIEQSWPRTGVRAIDSVLEAFAKAERDEFIVQAQDNNTKSAWSDELSFEVARNDGAVFSVIFTTYSYAGGAHPNSAFRTFHFLLPDGYQAELAELFTPRGIARISDISMAQLRRNLSGPGGMADGDWIRNGAGANARNFANFVLHPRELAIYFEPYQVAAYAAGSQEVQIPLSRLADTMRADVRAPAASFDCRAARSDIEHAICSSRELSALDRHLGETYAYLLTSAADDGRRLQLRQQQRAWLKGRNASCRTAGMNLVACLMPAYQKRLKVLEEGVN